MISTILRALFFLLVVRPLVLIGLGINIRRREALPTEGPAIIVANHNSHLDTLVILSLFPLALLPRVHPVAAADYFLRNRVLAWFATKIIGIIPIKRGAKGGNPLAPCFEALRRGEIVIIYPEGSRGEPEQMAEFKKGIALISRRFPEVPVIPLYLHGLGKALPKGEAILVPFFCDAFVGKPLFWQDDSEGFMLALGQEMKSLASEGHFPKWGDEGQD